MSEILVTNAITLAFITKGLFLFFYIVLLTLAGVFVWKMVIKLPFFLTEDQKLRNAQLRDMKKREKEAAKATADMLKAAEELRKTTAEAAEALKSE